MPPNASALVLGIHVGNTSCCVAVYRGGSGVEIAANEQGSRTTPTCIAFTEVETLKDCVWVYDVYDSVRVGGKELFAGYECSTQRTHRPGGRFGEAGNGASRCVFKARLDGVRDVVVKSVRGAGGRLRRSFRELDDANQAQLRARRRQRPPLRPRGDEPPPGTVGVDHDASGFKWVLGECGERPAAPRPPSTRHQRAATHPSRGVARCGPGAHASCEL